MTYSLLSRRAVVRIEVVSAMGRRLKQLRVTRVAQPTGAGGNGGGNGNGNHSNGSGGFLFF